MPFNKIFCAGNTALRNCGGLITGCSRRIAALGTKQTVNPSILVLYQPHIIDIGIRTFSFGHNYRIVPEPEIINPVKALRGSAKGEGLYDRLMEERARERARENP